MFGQDFPLGLEQMLTYVATSVRNDALSEHHCRQQKGGT
jgi:hypothetical protein